MNRNNPKIVRIIQSCILLLGLLVALLGVLLKEDTVLIVIGIVSMYGSIVYHFLFYRCPYCNAYLDRSRGEYCHYCGKKFE